MALMVGYMRKIKMAEFVLLKFLSLLEQGKWLRCTIAEMFELRTQAKLEGITCKIITVFKRNFAPTRIDNPNISYACF